MPRSARLARPFLVLLSVLLLSSCATASALAATLGEQRTAVLLVNFQDDPSQPIAPADAHALVFGRVSDFYWEASYGKTFLSGDTHGWFTLPVGKAGCDRDLIAREADRAAAAAGIDLSGYARLVYLFPQNGCSASGYNSGSTSVPSRTWIKGNAYSAYVVAHELGHNFGLLHSQAMDCGPAVLGGTCTTRSYGDPADTMGYGATPHFNAFQKERLAWLGAAGSPPITDVAASGRYAIEAYAMPGAGAKALKIPRGIDPKSGATAYYYVEYRQPVGFDAGLAEFGNLTRGVLVHSGVEGDGFSSYLLDMTPDSVPASSISDMEDGALEPGRTYVDAAAGITLTLVEADAARAVVDVRLSGDVPPPAGPLTGSVATDRSEYLRGDTVHMQARVERDGVPVHGAPVRFTVTLPSGNTARLASTTGSDGVARASYRAGKGKSALGTYGLRADATDDGAACSASAVFHVR